jgi:hypothetical protein
MEFKLHDQESAPEASKPLLEQAEKKYGFALNLFGVMAESPAALKAYTNHLADTPLDEAFQEKAWSKDS